MKSIRIAIAITIISLVAVCSPPPHTAEAESYTKIATKRIECCKAKHDQKKEVATQTVVKTGLIPQKIRATILKTLERGKLRKNKNRIIKRIKRVEVKRE